MKVNEDDHYNFKSKIRDLKLRPLKYNRILRKGESCCLACELNSSRQWASLWVVCSLYRF